MTTIKINTACKQYYKEDSSTRKNIITNLARLGERIENEGRDINTVFNNPTITYDRINDSIFLYKAHGKDNTQLRLLYSYTSEENTVFLIDYCKKKKNDKRYIALFNKKYKHLSPCDMSFTSINF